MWFYALSSKESWGFSSMTECGESKIRSGVSCHCGIVRENMEDRLHLTTAGLCEAASMFGNTVAFFDPGDHHFRQWFVSCGNFA